MPTDPTATAQSSGQDRITDSAALKLVAEVIILGGKTRIRLKQGPYLLGYFDTCDQVEQVLAGRGLSIADLHVKE